MAELKIDQQARLVSKTPFDSEKRPHGLWIISYVGEGIQFRATFRHGLLHGSYEHRNSYGEHIHKGFYRNDLAHGPWIHNATLRDTAWWLNESREQLMLQVEIRKTFRK